MNSPKTIKRRQSPIKPLVHAKMNTSIISPKEYIQLIRLKLRDIASLINGDVEIPKNKFNNNVIYIVFLTLKKFGECLANMNTHKMGNNPQLIMGKIMAEVLGVSELLSNALSTNTTFFLSATEFEKILTYQGVFQNVSDANIRINKLNTIMEYLVSELYEQINIFKTQSMHTIAKKNKEIGLWLDNIGYKEEIKSDAMFEAKPLINAISV